MVLHLKTTKKCVLNSLTNKMTGRGADVTPGTKGLGVTGNPEGNPKLPGCPWFLKTLSYKHRIH